MIFITRDDINHLFELLAIYRPGDPHLVDKRLRSAWLLVLEPFDPANVKNAVASYFRESKFWPDVTEISVRCNAHKEFESVKGQLTAQSGAVRSPHPDNARSGQPDPATVKEFNIWVEDFLNTYDPGWRERYFGDTSKSQAPGNLDKKTAASASNTDSGEETPHNP